MTSQTEAATIADLATRAAGIHEIDRGDRHIVVATPPGTNVQTIDIETYLDAPSRRRGTITALDADSFARIVGDLGPDTKTSIYADVQGLTVTAILNDHDGSYDAAGWRDHRVVLPVVRTPAWQRWLDQDNQIGDQTVFAQHLEDNLADIAEPDGADLLEMAQTFQASTEVQFRSAARLKDGQRQFTYSETIDAVAGRQGQIIVPDHFVLEIIPFEGGAPTRVIARLRYRLSGGRLAIGYQLHQPADVERDAFDLVVEKIGAATSLAPYRAKAPQAA